MNQSLQNGSGDACGRRIGAFDEPILEKMLAELPKHKHALRSLIEAATCSAASETNI